MKRLQISLEPELDRELDRVARVDGVSKAEVVRRCLRDGIEPVPPLEEDPIFDIIGAFGGADESTNDAENHDDVIYDPKWPS